MRGALALKQATESDVVAIAKLRAAAARHLTSTFGHGHWSAPGTENGVRLDLRKPGLFVARRGRRLIATLRLSTKKPWAIDPAYFTEIGVPLYLTNMAVQPGSPAQRHRSRLPRGSGAHRPRLAGRRHPTRCLRRRGWRRRLLRAMRFPGSRPGRVSIGPARLLRTSGLTHVADSLPTRLVQSRDGNTRANACRRSCGIDSSGGGRGRQDPARRLLPHRQRQAGDASASIAS